MEISVDMRLAVYGTLAPGKVNHNQIASLKGTWRAGVVCGRLLESGWAVDNGYPALILEPEGSQIPVQIFESIDLPAHWIRLDEFEGPNYRRVLTEVQTEAGPFTAWIYESTESDT